MSELDAFGSASSAPSVEVANDLVRRGLFVLPALVVVAGIARGVDGAISALLAVAIVLLNFTIAARGIAWASRISPNAVAGVVLAGYVLRLAIVSAAFLILRSQSWFDIYVFGFTLLVTHVGLLVWETRHVGLTLGAPGLKPGPMTTQPPSRFGKE